LNYDEFLQSKQKTYIASGFECEPSNKHLKPFQRAITKWALIKGKSGLFADTGHGKTIMQLSFADEICKKTGGKVLILAPLAVSAQTKREGDIVFSPFGGIGSEGYQALKMGRKAILIELKKSYYEQAAANLANCEQQDLQIKMF